MASVAFNYSSNYSLSADWFLSSHSYPSLIAFLIVSFSSY
jgi:hypothetical protein